jgi:hypothetical protein
LTRQATPQRSNPSSSPSSPSSPSSLPYDPALLSAFDHRANPITGVPVGSKLTAQHRELEHIIELLLDELGVGHFNHYPVDATLIRRVIFYLEELEKDLAYA